MVLAGRDLCHFQHPCATSRPPGLRAKIVPRWGCHFFHSWVQVDVLWWASWWFGFFCRFTCTKDSTEFKHEAPQFKKKNVQFYFIFFCPSPFLLSPPTSDGLQETCHVAHAYCLVLCGWIPTSGLKENKQHAFREKKRKTVKHDSALTVAASTHFQAINLSVRHFSDKGRTERKYCAGRERKRRTTRLQPCGVA